MGAARDELAAAAYWAEQRELAAMGDEPHPFDDAPMFPCRFCGRSLPGHTNHACRSCSSEMQR